MTQLPEIPRQHHFGDSFLHANILTISVDGQDQRMVMAYDIDAGWVERVVTSDGKPVLNADKTDVLTEKVHGRVVVYYDPAKVRRGK